MTVQATSPAVRPSIRDFEVVAVHLSAGGFLVDVQARDTAANVIDNFQLAIDAGRGIGLRYRADGSIERFTAIDPDITIAGAFASFANTAGGFGVRAAALEAWLQHPSRGLLPA